MSPRLNKEERVTVQVLIEKGISNTDIGEQLEVTEGAVRYHRNKLEAPKPDGRKDKARKADDYAHIIEHWMQPFVDKKQEPNIRELYDELVEFHDYEGSYKSVVRFVRAHYPPPKVRTYRRVETPPGAQVQTDWAEYPNVQLLDGTEGLHAFVMVLSHSRKTAVVWSTSQNQLNWLRCHNEAFRRLGGIPAVNRIDNVKTAVARGSGAWGELNQTYQSYAKTVRFHIDACPPRKANFKGKVEAKVRLTRLRVNPEHKLFSNIEELQSWTDERLESLSHKRRCPPTGKSVHESWQNELPYLATLPLLPEPFDIAVTRTVSDDCLICFEHREYAVPFEYARQQVEVRGCAQHVQILADGQIVREYPRGTEARLLIDVSCYEGKSTDRVLAPPPLGKMGKKLQELVEQPVEQRPMSLYEALAEVAR